MSNLASRWKRFWGALVDSLLAMTVTLPVMSLMGIPKQIKLYGKITLEQYAVLFVLGWIVFLAFNGYLLFRKGQTVGKVVVKTRIVDVNNKVPNFARILVFRYLILGLMAMIPILGIFVSYANALFIFGKERRCLHDYLAGTWVINA